MLLLILLFILIAYYFDLQMKINHTKIQKNKKLCCLDYKGNLCFSNNCPSGCNCQKNIRSYNQIQ